MARRSSANAFELLPAIDLRGGLVVRLVQGDFARETAYSDDPAAVAARFADEGASWLHIVDLDGARRGIHAHGEAINAIVEAVGDRLRVEVAGGIRTPESARILLDRGASRVVVGTAALRDPSFAAGLVRDHGAERIAVALDVRGGNAVGQGWAYEAAQVEAATALARLADAGVATFEVTAIERDGLLSGPDLELLTQLVDLGLVRIIASGGVTTTADLRAVISIGCAGAIVGRALYEGQLTLTEALDTIERASASGG